MTTLPAGVTARPFMGVADFAAIDAMTAALPYALHRIDLPWRLASPAACDPTHTRVWTAADGTPIAWAILQFPAWHCLDYEIVHGPHRAELEAAILTWAVEQLSNEASRRNADLPFYVSARSDDPERLDATRRAGFVSDDWGYVHMTRSLCQPLAQPVPVDGFQIRSLRGEAEVEAYVAAHRAAFATTNMTVDWRRRTLRDQRYVPDLDLVAESSDGRVVAFCVGWLLRTATDTMAQVEPLGVLPGFQRMGLGRALLAETFWRARSLGANWIEVDAESINDASRSLYESAGFRIAIDAPFALQRFAST